MDIAAGACVIGQFHEVIEFAGRFAAADTENLDLVGIEPRDGLKLADAVVFAFEGAVVIEGLAGNHLEGAVVSGGVAGEVDLAVGAAANGLKNDAIVRAG